MIRFHTMMRYYTVSKKTVNYYGLLYKDTEWVLHIFKIYRAVRHTSLLATDLLIKQLLVPLISIVNQLQRVPYYSFRHASCCLSTYNAKFDFAKILEHNKCYYNKVIFPLTILYKLFYFQLYFNLYPSINDTEKDIFLRNR